MCKLKLIIAASLAFMAAISTVSAQTPVRLGISPEPFMPFTQVDKAGKWEGLEADLSRAICAKLPMGKCEIKQMAWEGLIPALKENKIDFIVGAFSVTDDRRKVVDFSAPYYKEGTFLVGAKSDRTKIGTVNASDGSGKIIDAASLAGKTIGVQNASVQANYVAKYLKAVQVKSYDTADNSVADLIAGRIDFVLMSDLYAQTVLKSAAGKDYEVKLVAPKNTSLGEGVAYAVRKGDAKTLGPINAALASLTKDGSLQKMIDKWIFGKN